MERRARRATGLLRDSALRLTAPLLAATASFAAFTVGALLPLSPFLLGFRSADPMSDYLPLTAESLRGTITRAGLMSASEMDEALAGCRRHLRDPGTVSTLFTVAQVWGSTPIA